MPVAIKGILHNGKIKPLEKIPYKDEREVVILFLESLNSLKKDKIWDDAVSKNFLKGYAKKDNIYDKL